MVRGNYRLIIDIAHDPRTRSVFTDGAEENKLSGTTSGCCRVQRGGSWDLNNAYLLCAAYRNETNPEYKLYNSGFRVVCGPRR